MAQTPNEYSYINLSYLTEIADGDHEFIEESIRTYLQTIPAELNHLSTAINSGNCEQTAFHAHTLKGAFNFVGAEAIAALCGHIEEVCTSESTDVKLQSVLGEIVSGAKGVSEELKTALGNMQ